MSGDDGRESPRVYVRGIHDAVSIGTRTPSGTTLTTSSALNDHLCTVVDALGQSLRYVHVFFTNLYLDTLGSPDHPSDDTPIYPEDAWRQLSTAIFMDESLLDGVSSLYEWGPSHFAKLRQSLSHGTSPDSNPLLSLLSDAHRLSLSGSVPTSTSVPDAPLPMPLCLQKGVAEAKAKEIVLLGRVIRETVPLSTPSVGDIQPAVVDFGAGKGYLSHYIAETTPYTAVALEGSRAHTQRLLKRTVQLFGKNGAWGKRGRSGPGREGYTLPGRLVSRCGLVDGDTSLEDVQALVRGEGEGVGLDDAIVDGPGAKRMQQQYAREGRDVVAPQRETGCPVQGVSADTISTGQRGEGPAPSSAPSPSPLCLVGLHACGDLSAMMCRIMTHRQRLRGTGTRHSLITVPCCYTHLTPAHFPLSQGMRERLHLSEEMSLPYSSVTLPSSPLPYTVGGDLLNAANQYMGRASRMRGGLGSFVARAGLQRLIKLHFPGHDTMRRIIVQDKAPQMPWDVVRHWLCVGAGGEEGNAAVSSNLDALAEWAHRVLRSLPDRPCSQTPNPYLSPSTPDLSLKWCREQFTTVLQRTWEMGACMLARAAVGQMMETFILLDRAVYLAENSPSDSSVCVFPVFPLSLSPRSRAVCVVPSTDTERIEDMMGVGPAVDKI
ncbi:hypothetical protein KIPB_005994 [Kipferlia bialata]|uniref:Methyltransferase domain-containing protein n=1 Tax=Kipferlia bialata TaxID=797122 RepID=A0A391P2X0_9EUKA|nr:hypothetical protein KIPB_005994 [Kipferlia bialata]|eukprot:g5994.t1